MKYFISIIILLSIFIITSLGSFLVIQSMTDHSDCIASSITGVLCPSNVNELLTHHIKILQTLSISSPVILGVVLFILSLFVFYLFFRKKIYKSLSLLFFYLKNDRDRNFSHLHPFLFWLSLFELSTSF